MLKCFMCEQEVNIESQPVYRFGRPYCAKCAAKYDAVAQDIKNMTAQSPPAAWPSWARADVIGLTAFILFIVGLSAGIMGGSFGWLLCLIGFILALFSLGDDQWPFSTIVFTMGLFILGILLLVGLVAVVGMIV